MRVRRLRDGIFTIWRTGWSTASAVHLAALEAPGFSRLRNPFVTSTPAPYGVAATAATRTIVHFTLFPLDVLFTCPLLPSTL